MARAIHNHQIQPIKKVELAVTTMRQLGRPIGNKRGCRHPVWCCSCHYRLNQMDTTAGDVELFSLIQLRCPKMQIPKLGGQRNRRTKSRLIVKLITCGLYSWRPNSSSSLFISSIEESPKCMNTRMILAGEPKNRDRFRQYGCLKVGSK